MRTSSIIVICLALLVATTAAAIYPSPQLAYVASPENKENGQCIPTAPPLLMEAFTGVWLSYDCIFPGQQKSHAASTTFVEYSTNTTQESIGTQGDVQFTNTPILASPTGPVLVYTTDSKWSAVIATHPGGRAWGPIVRNDSTAGIAYDPDDKLAVIPIGGQGTEENLQSINVTTGVLGWKDGLYINPGAIKHDNIGTPQFYEKDLFLLQNNTLYKIHADTGDAHDIKTDPCGLSPIHKNEGQSGRELHLRIIQFHWEMKNGQKSPLAGLFITGNASYQGGQNQVYICRVSHHDLNKTEFVVAPYLAEEIVDIVGGCNHIYVIGISQVWDISPDRTGETWPVPLQRSYADQNNLPAFVEDEQDVTQSLVVMQVGGHTQAYSTHTGQAPSPIWVASNIECNYKAAVFGMSPNTLLACSGPNYLTLMYGINGSVIWQDTGVKPVFSPIFSADGKLVFVVDIYNVFHGYYVTSGKPAPPPGPEGHPGVTAGEVILIIFVLVFLIVLGVAVMKAWNQRSAKRQAVRAGLDAEGYGGLNP